MRPRVGLGLGLPINNGLGLRVEIRYPSSTLFPFLSGGLLIKAEYQEKGTLITN